MPVIIIYNYDNMLTYKNIFAVIIINNNTCIVCCIYNLERIIIANFIKSSFYIIIQLYVYGKSYDYKL